MLLGTLGLGALAPHLFANSAASRDARHEADVRERAHARRQRYCVEHVVPSALYGHASAAGDLFLETIAGRLPPPHLSAPMSAATSYPIGSVGKLAVGALALRALEENRIALDTTVARFLPTGIWQEAAGPQTTFAHLGAHTTGLAEPIAHQPFQVAIVAEPARRRTAQETLSAALALPRRHAVGEKHSYSNANTVLLAKAIESIRNDAFTTLLRETSMSLAGRESPLQHPASDLWRRSDTRAFRHSREGRPMGYGSLFTDVTEFNPSWSGAGGDWSARIGDLLALGRYLLATAVLAPAWFDTFLAPTPSARSNDRGYGFHCMRRGEWFGHIGDVPGFSAALWMHPVSGECVAAISNLSNTAQGRNPADDLIWLA
jgi:D-alanyl-D-alanine carboxypeptidase